MDARNPNFTNWENDLMERLSNERINDSGNQDDNDIPLNDLVSRMHVRSPAVPSDEMLSSPFRNSSTNEDSRTNFLPLGQTPSENPASEGFEPLLRRLTPRREPRNVSRTQQRRENTPGRNIGGPSAPQRRNQGHNEGQQRSSEANDLIPIRNFPQIPDWRTCALLTGLPSMTSELEVFRNLRGEANLPYGSIIDVKLVLSRRRRVCAIVQLRNSAKALLLLRRTIRIRDHIVNVHANHYAAFGVPLLNNVPQRPFDRSFVTAYPVPPPVQRTVRYSDLEAVHAPLRAIPPSPRFSEVHNQFPTDVPPRFQRGEAQSEAQAEEEQAEPEQETVERGTVEHTSDLETLERDLRSGFRRVESLLSGVTDAFSRFSEAKDGIYDTLSRLETMNEENRVNMNKIYDEVVIKINETKEEVTSKAEAYVKKRDEIFASMQELKNGVPKIVNVDGFSRVDIECIVCQEVMTDQINQCANGHCVCSSCYKRLEHCPCCRSKLDKKNPIRNRLGETICRAIYEKLKETEINNES